jgi:ankyrin repeat protein
MDLGDWCRTGDTTRLQELLAEGADVETDDHDDYNYLHLAILYGYVGIVEALIKAGVNVNKKSFHGKTALHNAIDYDRFEIIKLLLDQADLSIKDDKGRTPLDLSMKDNIREFIVNYGYDIKEPDE